MALKYKAKARQGTTVMKAAKKQSAMKKHTDMKKRSAMKATMKAVKAMKVMKATAKRVVPTKAKSYLGYIVFCDDLDFDKQASINLHNNGTNVFSVSRPLKPRHVYRVNVLWNTDLEDDWVDGHVVKARYVGPRADFTGQQKYDEMLGVEDSD